MYTKAKKTISHVTPQRPMTEEEKRQQIAQILMQKRGQFAINILCNMVQGWNCVSSDHETALDLVDTSVKMADALMEKLYPIKEDKAE